MITKDERQLIGIKKFIHNNHIGILKYIMGFGKTITALKIIDYYIHTKKNANVVIVVPSVVIYEMWTDEISKYKSYYDDLDISMYITLYTIYDLSNSNYLELNIDLLIVDEIHKFTSDKRYNILKTIKYNHILGLTGVTPDKKILELVPIIDDISYSEAIHNNWISNFHEFNIKLELTDTDKEKYIEYSKVIRDVLDIFTNTHKRFIDSNGKYLLESPFDVIMACYKGKKFGNTYVKSYLFRESLSIKMGYTPTLDLDNPYYNKIDKYWSPDAIKQNVTRFYVAMKSRNTIHDYNEVKIEAVLRLYQLFSDKNIIIFNENIKMADTIVDTINNYIHKPIAIAYHSKIKPKPMINFETNDYFRFKNGKIKPLSKAKYLDYIKDGFKLNKLNVLSTVNAVDEGFNLELLNLVITTSGTTNPIQYNQRNARGIRIDYYNPNKVTIIINLYFDDFMKDGIFYKSRDKTKLYKRQENNAVKTFTLQNFTQYIKNI